MAGCPNCGFTHASLADYTGKTIKCPKCQSQFLVTADPVAASPAPPPPVSVPSPAAAGPAYPDSPPRPAGAGKAASGGIGALIVLALIGFRVYSGCNRAGGDECVRFNDQVLNVLGPVEVSLKSLDATADKLKAGQDAEAEFMKGAETLKTVLATSRQNAEALTAPKHAGAKEFLASAKDYIASLESLVAKILDGTADDAAGTAVEQARDRMKSAQKRFADANKLILK